MDEERFNSVGLTIKLVDAKVSNWEGFLIADSGGNPVNTFPFQTKLVAEVALTLFPKGYKVIDFRTSGDLKYVIDKK